jgi:hypothetical protein
MSRSRSELKLKKTEQKQKSREKKKTKTKEIKRSWGWENVKQKNLEKTKKNIEKTKKIEKTQKENPEVLGGGGSAKSLRILVLLFFFWVFSKCLTFLHGALPKESQNIDLFAVCVFDFIVKYTFAHMFQISICTVCLICV